MFSKFKILLPIILALMFCVLVRCEASQLDPIAAPHFAVTKDTIIVPIDKLRPSEKVTSEAVQLMQRKMNDPNYPKHKPLDVIKRGDGTFTIIDGNKIFSALRELGAKNFPVIVHAASYQKNVSNIKELYALNRAAEDEFNNLMNELQRELGGELIKRPTIKSESRVREKAKLELNGDYSAVTDLLAASLYYPDEESLLAAFDNLKNRDDVIEINDRWNNPLPQGYKDFQLSIILSNGAIVELQLHHSADKELNYGLDHYIYEFRRANYGKPEMMSYLERARNCQKSLYASAWDGSFATLDDATKDLLTKTAKQLANQKSPHMADFYLKRLERIFKFALGAERIAA